MMSLNVIIALSLAVRICILNAMKMNSTICQFDVGHYCSASNASRIIKETCNMKRICYINRFDDVFGDPCPNTSKYIQIVYACAQIVQSTKKDDSSEEEDASIIETNYYDVPTEYIANVCANDYCNLTACDAVEICRREIKEKRIVDNEEHTDSMLIKLERRLRSLEQPVWTTHIGNDRWIRCAAGSCKCRPETKSVSCWHAQMSVLPANQIIPHDIINIDLAINQLTTLNKGAFHGLTHLTELDLFDNRIDFLPEPIFEDLDSLSNLRLHKNSLDELSKDIFLKLRNLKSLDLSQNSIKSLSGGLFRGNMKINIIHLSRNKVMDLSEDVFADLSMLEDLDMTTNKLKYLKKNIFKDLISLKRLKLAENLIIDIEMGVFDNLISLEYLTLRKNKLMTIPRDLFKDLHHLLVLDLSSNRILNMQGSEFFNLHKLTELHLEQNDIDEIPMNLFNETKNLQKLFLFSNNLEHLHSYSFEGLDNLTSLLLNNNMLKTIDENTFFPTPKLQKLHLDSNRFQYLPAKALDNLLELVNIKLAKNPWHCDCAALYLATWLKQNRDKVWESQPTCRGPGSLGGVYLRVSLLYFASINAALGCQWGSECWIDLTDTECIGTVNVDVNNNADITVPVREYEVKNINAVETLTSSLFANINLNEEKTHVIITLTEQFKKFAEIADIPEFAIRVNLIGCDDKDLHFIFKVKEVYNNPPEFVKESYEIDVGSPILPSAEIKGISAKDIDILNKHLKFTICNDPNSDYYFTDSVKNPTNKKIYDTILKTKKVVELEDDVTLKICVTDSHNDPKTVETTLTLKIDKTASKTPDPVFQEPVYWGKYDMKTGLVSEISTSLSNALYTIKNAQLPDYRDNFELKLEKNVIKISGRSDSLISEEDLMDKTYILMILEAEYEGADRVGKTVILLDIEGNTDTTTTTTASTTLSTTITDCPTIPTTTATECPPCSTTVTECPTTTSTECPPCSTTVTECPTTTATECPPCSTTVTECPTTTECPITTATECPPCSSTVTEKCPATTATECPPCSSTVTECPPCSTSTAVTSTDITSTTTCPTWTQCPICPGTTTTTSPTDTTTDDSGTITSTSTTVQPVIVKYDSSERNFAINSNEIGIIDMVVATSTIREDIEYRIEKTSNDEVILPNLAYNLTTGELTRTSFIETGIYHFTLMATGKISSSQGKINIILTSDATSVCNGEPVLTDSLIIKRVLEDETEEIAVQKHQEYELKITGEKPKWIEERDGSIWIVEPDREDPSLGSMITPQVSVIVEARKKNTGTNTNYYNSTLTKFERNAYNARDQFEDCIHISNIKKSSVRMTIVVIIEDKNDNDPEFDNSNPVAIGYPNSQLAEFVAPAYLTQVSATDKDSGYNALIKYSIDDPKFIVDPYTGIIYPGLGALDQDKEYEIKVLATDEDGNGRSAEHTIKVKILNEKHISVLKLKNVAYSDLNEYILKLSKDIEKNVQYLTSTAISTTKDTEKLQKSMFADDEKNSMMKIVTYALDNQNEPILASEFKKLIEDTDLEASVEEYEIPSGQVNPTSTPPPPPPPSCDNTGFIAAVSALSVLLALIIIGVILVYIFFIRPRMVQTKGFKKHESATPPAATNYKTRNTNIYSSVADRRPTGFPAGFKPDDIEVTDEIVKPKETENEDKDEGVYHSETSSNEDPDRKKSIVKFDKNVTEIEIEKF
ncbi:uncharacterized protein CBL_06551 [Carabus blaptoides fortunei]